MICPNCAADVAVDAAFCGQCGTALSGAAHEAATTAQVPIAEDDDAGSES